MFVCCKYVFINLLQKQINTDTQNKKRAAEQLIYYSRPRTYGDEDKQTAAQVLTSPRSTKTKFNNNYLIITTMKTNKPKTMTPQVRFTLALNATWSILRDPVLTKIYVRKWKRQNGLLVTIYGYVFREMYKAV